MDAAEVFRAVRRREGLNQHALAARSGVALSTVEAVEAGRRTPTTAVVTAVLQVAGLELAMDLPVPDVPPETVEHLHRSLPQRLHLACGGDGTPRPRTDPAAWRQLRSLTAHHVVRLHGRTALALWLPLPLAPPLEVCAQPRPYARRPAAATPALAVAPACEQHRSLPVVVRCDHWQVEGDAPADLALEPDGGSHRAELRAVARLLHQQAARDQAGRRTRAHRDPDHGKERTDVFHTKRFHGVPMPPVDDTRGWRLADDGSRDAWLRRHGHPV